MMKTFYAKLEFLTSVILPLTNLTAIMVVTKRGCPVLRLESDGVFGLQINGVPSTRTERKNMIGLS
jgi:hypothetical protein